jgi:hypothetical protein
MRFPLRHRASSFVVLIDGGVIRHYKTMCYYVLRVVHMKQHIMHIVQMLCAMRHSCAVLPRCVVTCPCCLTAAVLFHRAVSSHNTTMHTAAALRCVLHVACSSCAVSRATCGPKSAAAAGVHCGRFWGFQKNLCWSPPPTPTTTPPPAPPPPPPRRPVDSRSPADCFCFSNGRAPPLQKQKHDLGAKASSKTAPVD